MIITDFVLIIFLIKDIKIIDFILYLLRHPPTGDSPLIKGVRGMFYIQKTDKIHFFLSGEKYVLQMCARGHGERQMGWQVLFYNQSIAYKKDMQT